MDVNADTTPPSPHGHHLSARERQRKGPMWGCLRLLTGGVIVLLLLLAVIGGGIWIYLGSPNFADFVRTKVETTLSSRLGRPVTIGSVEIDRLHFGRAVLTDLRIGNPPGTVRPYFATARQVVITGGVQSFWGRNISVGRIEVIDPRMDVEIFPAGAPLLHNVPHWQSPPPSRFQIVHVALDKMFLEHGQVDFLDRRHNIEAVAGDVESTISVASAKDLYTGLMSSPQLHVRLQDYVPFDMTVRGRFRYTPGALQLHSVALDGGSDLRLIVNGGVDPAHGVYNLRLNSVVGLQRVRDIFRVHRKLDGMVEGASTLRGREGNFVLAGGWSARRVRADVYEMTNLRGLMRVDGSRATVDVQDGDFAGGAFTAYYQLPRYVEPYPMSVDVRYHGLSMEQLFGNWGLANSGLRGSATGRLVYHWNKDKILEGAGDGTAILTKNPTAISGAKYATPVSGSADFALDRGVITFRKSEMATESTQLAMSGTLRIEDVSANLQMKIQSGDFAELDRIGYNLAHATGKKSYTLLGLGGVGDVTGSVKGPLRSPEVRAHVVAAGTRFNGSLLGESDINLSYSGPRDLLTLTPAAFHLAGGSLSLTGTVAFPNHEPSPQFDLAVDAANYPIERAMGTVNVKLTIGGLGTGRLVVSGTPDSGRVQLTTLTIRQPQGSLHLAGPIDWAPGSGNVRVNLDASAQSFPVTEIVKFLDIGALPVIGDLTGSLHIDGPKSALEGNGQIAVHNGSIYGEPMTLASADVSFTRGTLRATNIRVAAPAGTLTGEAELNETTSRFAYSLQSAAINLSQLQVISRLAGFVSGNLTISSSGSGTFQQPEIVLNATLNQATVRGVNLPAGAPPPTIYLSVHNEKLVVRGSVADALTMEGNGSVGTDGSLNGLIQVRVPDLARLLAMIPGAASMSASGGIAVDLQLGGKLTSLESLQVNATFPEFNIQISDDHFAPRRPLRVALRNGRIVFDDFDLSLMRAGEATATTFGITGTAELTGAKNVNIDVRGTLEAALLQLLIPGVRTEGHIKLTTTGIRGTLRSPSIGGAAEFQDVQLRVPGFPQLIDHITGTLVFRGDRVDIDSLHASVGGGTVVAGGSIALSGVTPVRASITLQGTGVAIRYFEGITLEGDFLFKLAGDPGRAILQGDVNVSRALYFRDIDIGNAILGVLLSRKGVTPVVAASWQDHVSLRVHLTAGQGTLAVRNNIAEVTGSGALDLTGTLANPSVLGSVTLDEGGRVRFQNIDYQVLRGSINFQNPFRIDPYFDITLQARVSGGLSEIESGPIDVTVNMTGTLDRITPTITSEPPASDVTLFSLLGFGAYASTSAGSPGANALFTRQSLLSQSVNLLGQRVLPFVDAFSYDPGLLDTDPGPKVSFEKRLSNDVRLFVVHSLRDQKNRVVIEWTVNGEWVLQFTRDEMSNEYRAEARFRRTYEGHWTWGSRGRNPAVLFAHFLTLSPPKARRSEPVIEPVLPPGTPNVTSIGFTADSRFDTAVLEQYVAVRIGAPLSMRQVQSSIRSLYATGDFRDIQVSTTPASDGVALTFALFVNYRVGEIDVDGLSRADRDRAQRELTFRLGDVFSLNAVDRSATSMQNYLNHAGYLEATVDPETMFTHELSEAAVIFHVTRGPRAKVGSVVVEGDVAPFTADQLIGRMRRGPNQAFELSEARGDAERMKDFMLRGDYRKADVRFLSDSYDAHSKSVALRYQATSGPLVRVEVTGVPSHAVRGLIPFRRNQAYSEDVIDKASQDIINNYQAHGDFNATVDTEEELTGNVWTIIFRVKPGVHYELAAVTFSGNQKLSARKLAGVITTTVPSPLRSFFRDLFYRPAGVTRTQLSDDRDALESLYRLNGFSEVQVGTAGVKTNDAAGTMTVDFPIVEGPQTVLTAVNVVGNEQVSSRKLPQLLLKTGAPLNPQAEREDVVTLQSFYADRGNVEAQVRPREEISADKDSATVTYTIAEGPEIKVDQVVVRGNTYTKSNVVLRQAQIDRGDPFSYTSILEAQRNLYRLGIFNRVDIEPGQTGTSVSDRNILISVEEGKDLTFAGSAGLTSGIQASNNHIAPLGSISVAHRNLFGTGRYVGLQLIGAFGATSRRDAFLTYREPFIGPWDIPVQLTLFQTDEPRLGAHLRQRGTFIEASRVVGQQTRLSLRYEYRISNCLIEQFNDNDLCYEATQALVPGVDRSITNIRISDLTPAFFWDKRDDPINPHRGFFASASIEYAFRAFAADADFLKEFGQGSWYLPVTQRSVFAFSSRLGVIQDLGRHPGPTGPISGVPLSERFTAGGDSSNRGYALDLLGTVCLDPSDTSCHPTLVRLENGTIAPIGGLGLFIANAEYRFPVYENLGGALFVDAGNVFDNTAITLDNLRYGVGAGARYLSPVGPVRFDVGYKLRRQIIGFDVTGQPIREKPFAYFITIGYAF